MVLQFGTGQENIIPAVVPAKSLAVRRLICLADGGMLLAIDVDAGALVEADVEGTEVEAAEVDAAVEVVAVGAVLASDSWPSESESGESCLLRLGLSCLMGMQSSSSDSTSWLRDTNSPSLVEVKLGYFYQDLDGDDRRTA